MLFPGQTLGNTPEQVCCLSSRNWFPKCPTPPRSALLAPYSQEEQGKPQSYPSAPRLIDPTILHLPKEGSEQVGRESGRRWWQWDGNWGLGFVWMISRWFRGSGWWGRTKETLTPLPIEGHRCDNADFFSSIPPEINTHEVHSPQPLGPCFMTFYQTNCHEREIKPRGILLV